DDVSDDSGEKHFGDIQPALKTCSFESIMPTIVQSVGVLSRLNGNEASFPRHQKTSSPTPAPIASSASVGFPFSFRPASSVWMMRIFRPSRASFFTVETTVRMTRAICISSVGQIDRIDDADYRRIDRTVFVAFGHARRRTAHDDDLFVKTGTDSIDGDDV